MSKNTSAPPAADTQVDDTAPGVLLCKARQKCGISEQQMCQHLGLTLRALRALEADDYEQLPAPVFVRGYLRNYCEIVRLRPSPVLASFETHYRIVWMARQPLPVMATRSPIAVLAGSFCACLMASTLVFWTLYSEGKEFSPGRVFQEAGPPGEAVKPSQRDRHGSVTSRAVSASGNGSLVFAFHTDSWVEVIDANDHILAVDLYRKGATLQLDGKPPFRVTLGHGPGVKITFEGKSITFNSDPETLAANMTLGR